MVILQHNKQNMNTVIYKETHSYDYTIHTHIYTYEYGLLHICCPVLYPSYWGKHGEVAYREKKFGRQCHNVSEVMQFSLKDHFQIV